MSTQELLTYLLKAITISFMSIALFDFGERAIKLYKNISADTSTKLSINYQIKQLPPNPSLLEAEKSVENPQSDIASSSQSAQKPPLVLALAKAAGEVRSRSVESIANKPTIDEVLQNLDVYTLKLRPARKIAKMLGIAQKVDGKDQKLSFLRSQSRRTFRGRFDNIFKLDGSRVFSLLVGR